MGAMPWSFTGFQYNRSISDWNVSDSGLDSVRQSLENTTLHLWLYETSSSELLTHYALEPYEEILRFPTPLVLAAGKTYSVLMSLPVIMLTGQPLPTSLGGNVQISAYRFGLAPNVTYSNTSEGLWSNLSAEWFPTVSTGGYYPGVPPPWWGNLPDEVYDTNGSLISNASGTDSSSAGWTESGRITKEGAMAEGFTFFQLPSLTLTRYCFELRRLGDSSHLICAYRILASFTRHTGYDHPSVARRQL